MSLTGRDSERWLAGQHPAGAVYGVGERVRVRAGPVQPRCGKVVLLADVEPEPRYLIEIAPGHYVQVRQSDLLHDD